MRILLVEDEHKIAAALKRGLEQEGYAVDCEYDSAAGLAAALNDSYDLMVFDRMLPGGQDGLDMCRAVRAEGIHAPILLLTAKDRTEDRVAGLDGGADDYLVKPFAFEELLARLRALLRRPANALDAVLRYEDLVLDTATYSVSRGGTAIQLSRKEFSLLEYLLRNPERILTKETIMSHVWNFDADILPNTVEVYIGYLRQKVDKPFRGPNLIQTVRGFGYRLGNAATNKARS